MTKIIAARGALATAGGRAFDKASLLSTGEFIVSNVRNAIDP